jgi:hypothetical protein
VSAVRVAEAITGERMLRATPAVGDAGGRLFASLEEAVG